MQTLTINTSGDVELNLTDKYGVLEVEACQVEGIPEQVCIVPIIYTYTLENIGSTDMDITVLECTWNNITVVLTNQVTDQNRLSPGDTASASENEDLNICVEGLFQTTVRAEADPPNGNICLDSDMFVFEIQPGCRTNVDITCVSEDGVDCIVWNLNRQKESALPESILSRL